MDQTELADMHKAQLVDQLHMAQHVMQGFTRTILLVSKTISGEDVDGAELTEKAALIIAEMLLKEAAEKRKVNDIGEAEIRERAVEQFSMVIRETLRMGQPRQ
ncbi:MULTISPECIES: hypothetical protein [unclassified Bosea (in: a-proteobacteria)]|uniref:hypothetical protein n=1 Tax=unclassified Bosea (in: a-proteobacteria) TaxID=2653178 RepID=UPI000F7E75DD|nr:MULTISPECIES: hypothetical protein [unclassified Bosea (in: a-proteobacteria)]